MLHPSKSALAVTGTIVAAGLITLMSPKTVHAVAAALVEVTNTSSNPVVTQTTGAQAANMVHVKCVFTNGNNRITPCTSYITSAGVFESSYTVPSGNYLVITAADVLPVQGDIAECPGNYFAAIVSNVPSSEALLGFSTSDNPVTNHFAYPPPSGVVIPPGTVLSAGGAISNTNTGLVSSNCTALELIDLYGYLTTS